MIFFLVFLIVVYCIPNYIYCKWQELVSISKEDNNHIINFLREAQNNTYFGNKINLNKSDSAKKGKALGHGI